MLNNLKAGLLRLFRIGTEQAVDSTDRRKLLLRNVGACIGISSLLIYDFFFLLSGAHSARLASLSHLPFYFGFASIFWLNQKQHYFLAGWLIMLSALLVNLLPMVIAFGTHFNHHHYFILFAIVPIALFSAKRWPTVAFLFLLNSALFIWFELNGMDAAPDIMAIDSSLVTTYRVLLSFMVILTLATFFWAYDIFAGRSERELQQLSMTDSLTQLPNRRHFENVFQQEVSRAKRTGAPVSIAFMDIDRFKTINDTYGHNLGDKVINHVAAVVTQTLRAGSMVARFGGDELVVLMPNASVDEAGEAMERVRIAIASARCECDGVEMVATVSVGVAAVDLNDTITDAYRKADEQLYEAKEAGRNVVKRLALV